MNVAFCVNFMWVPTKKNAFYVGICGIRNNLATRFSCIILFEMTLSSYNRSSIKECQQLIWSSLHKNLKVPVKLKFGYANDHDPIFSFSHFGILFVQSQIWVFLNENGMNVVKTKEIGKMRQHSKYLLIVNKNHLSENGSKNAAKPPNLCWMLLKCSRSKNSHKCRDIIKILLSLSASNMLMLLNAQYFTFLSQRPLLLEFCLPFEWWTYSKYFWMKL